MNWNQNNSFITAEYSLNIGVSSELIVVVFDRIPLSPSLFLLCSLVLSFFLVYMWPSCGSYHLFRFLCIGTMSTNATRLQSFLSPSVAGVNGLCVPKIIWICGPNGHGHGKFKSIGIHLLNVVIDKLMASIDFYKQHGFIPRISKFLLIFLWSHWLFRKNLNRPKLFLSVELWNLIKITAWF